MKRKKETAVATEAGKRLLNSMCECGGVDNEGDGANGHARWCGSSTAGEAIAAIEAEAAHDREVVLRHELGDACGQRVLEAVAAERARITKAVREEEGMCHDGEGLGCDSFPCVENISRAAVLAAVNPEP
jgi:hypothetical protein